MKLTLFDYDQINIKLFTEYFLIIQINEFTVQHSLAQSWNTFEPIAL